MLNSDCVSIPNPMFRSQIESFGRVRPPLSNNVVSYGVRYNQHPPGQSDHRAYLDVVPPPGATDFMGQGNSSFPFHEVFDFNAAQEDVFNRVGAPMVHNCLEGINGTIFCYGQTGSGKTFTMAGDVTFEGRGIIPRALELIFNIARARRKQEIISVKISCMEIYNEVIYDLLPVSLPNNGGPGSVPLECWPRVTVAEDAATGGVRLKGLSEHEATTLERALALLFQGSLNRVVATTPMNDASSRGHCIFTIQLAVRPKGSDGSSNGGGVGVVRTSKLHLVDLAGSERVRKSGAEGALLSEAKHINLSLHFLEQVIVALHEKNVQTEKALRNGNSSLNGGRSSSVARRSGSVGPNNRPRGAHVHVPYRNSTLTSVLRDSFGGNCKTVVLSNISVDQEHYDESVSTARFAQRCSLLANDISVNEHCAVVGANGELLSNDPAGHQILLREYKKLDDERKQLKSDVLKMQVILKSVRDINPALVDEILSKNNPTSSSMGLNSHTNNISSSNSTSTGSPTFSPFPVDLVPSPTGYSNQNGVNSMNNPFAPPVRGRRATPTPAQQNSISSNTPVEKITSLHVSNQLQVQSSSSLHSASNTKVNAGITSAATGSSSSIQNGQASSNNSKFGKRSSNEPRVWRLAEVLEHVEKRGLTSKQPNILKSPSLARAEDVEFSCVGDLALLIREILTENQALKQNGSSIVTPPTQGSPLQSHSSSMNVISSSSASNSSSNIKYHSPPVVLPSQPSLTVGNQAHSSTILSSNQQQYHHNNNSSMMAASSGAIGAGKTDMAAALTQQHQMNNNGMMSNNNSISGATLSGIRSRQV